MVRGVLAGVAAWVGMTAWALLGVSLAGFGAQATPAALALAVGGSARLTREVGPARLEGTISVLPLGVSLVGAVLLAVVLTTWPRVLGAALAFVAGLTVLLFVPSGDLEPGVGPTLLGGLCWLLVVLGVRVAMWWHDRVRAVVVVLLGACGLATVIGALAAVAGGTRVLGTMVLAAPNLLCVALTRGLGVPWTVHGPDVPMPSIDAGGLAPLAAPLWPLALVAAALVVAVAVFAGWHTPWVAGVVCCAMVALGGAAVQLRTGMFGIDLGVRGDLLVAAGAGLAAGSVACLLVAGGRYWHRRWT